MSELVLLKYATILFVAVCVVMIGWNYVVKARLSNFSQLLLSIVLFIGFAFTYAYLVEPNWIEVNRVRVKDAQLKKTLGNTRIVHISDLHLNEGIGYRERKLVKKVNSLKPDLIFITGDFIDDLSQVKVANELLSSLRANKAIYGVPGNTDHIVMDSQSLARELKPSGIKILINEGEEIVLPNRNRIWLIGVDDTKYDHANVKSAIRNLPESATSIMLSHSPDVIQSAEVSAVNLILAGDTHGGQIGILPLVRMSEYANRTKYIRGHFKENGTQMYVNRGIGMKTVPIRFLCRPEISVIEARS